MCDAHLILAARGNPAPVLEGLEPWWLRPEGASRLRIGLRGRSDGRPAIPYRGLAPRIPLGAHAAAEAKRRGATATLGADRFLTGKSDPRKLHCGRFEDLFYRFSLRPSLFICERFFLRSDVIRPLFKHILWRFQQIFYRTFSALHGSLRQACLILAGSGVVGSPRLLGELFPASMTLQQ